ncbi:MAG: efflux transporter periplasmic adaptor subunit [Rhodospirillales bacterium]|nr:efflux transporter periplasmic adaptor subunit [Rhodospirillales bacterium]
MEPEHNTAPIEPIRTPHRRFLWLAGGVAFVILGAVAVTGMIARANSERQLVTWTDAQAIPTVALATLTYGDAGGGLTLPGRIQPFNKALIYARVSGYLKSWQSDIGAQVKAGQELAVIDTPDLDQQLDQAKADLASADANEQLAALTAKRWRALLTTQSVAQQAADEKTGDAAAKKAIKDAAEANVRRLEAMETFKTIVAPFDGIVTARTTDIGALINAGGGTGQELFEVSDLHKIRIYVQVPQAFTAELQPGMQASFEMPQHPGRQFTATLVTTSNAMNMNSASMLVELQTDNADGALKAGAYCQVHFQLPNDAKLVRLPATALAPTDRGLQVAVLGDDNRVTLKAVQLGRDFGDNVEVAAGLSPSDRVIDNPPETLESGDAVQLAAAKPSSSTKQVAGQPAAKGN